MIGDDLVANSFQQYILDAVRQRKLYMTMNYEVKHFAVKSYCSHVQNVLARVKLQFAKALNEETRLPKTCIFVLNDDIIRHSRLNEVDASSILNEIMPWLLKEVQKLTNIHKDQLPQKAVRDTVPNF